MLTLLESVVPSPLRMTSLTVASPKTDTNGGYIRKMRRKCPCYGIIKECSLNKVLNQISQDWPMCREVLTSIDNLILITNL